MKHLLNYMLASALFALSALGQSSVTTLTTGGTAYSVATTPKSIGQLILTAGTTNLTTLKLYDSSTTGTNMVRGAYTSLLTYTTNYSTVFTNANGVLVTNTFTGPYSELVSNAAVTNERPIIYQTTVPASGTKTIDLDGLTFIRGITAVASHTATIDITYE